MRLAFVWHWQKRTTPTLAGAFAAEDTLIRAIARLTTEGEQAVIFTLVEEPYAVGRFFNERQGLWYCFVRDRRSLLEEVKCFDPDMVMLNHNPKAYGDIVGELAATRARKAIYYSAHIALQQNVLQSFDGFFVHHPYQKEELKAQGIDSEKIFVAPKTADLDVFRPIEGITKKWDCIYPTRGAFGYLKRIELAVRACGLIGATIVLPGATIPGTFDRQIDDTIVKIIRRTPRCFRKVVLCAGKALNYPWATTQHWLSPEELNVRYNEARCLVVTTNDKEVGPRIIPEAAACNLPIVCCADSRACVSHTEVLGGYIAAPTTRDVASKITAALSSVPKTRTRLEETGLDTWVIYRALRKALAKWAL